MLNMTVTSILAFIGLVLFFVGLILILAGFKIADFDKLIKVIDRENPLTWKVGITLALLGLGFLYPQITKEINPSVSNEVAIALTNKHCQAMDYYVDNNLVVSVEAESTAIFNVKTGPHWVQACRVGFSKVCGAVHKVNWISTTEELIVRGASCPVTITIINKHCWYLDYYVDDVLKTTIKPEGQSQIKVTSGKHYYQICNTGTKECSDRKQVNWTGLTSEYINRGSTCK